MARFIRFAPLRVCADHGNISRGGTTYFAQFIYGTRHLKSFRADYGPNLEIFKAKFDNSSKIQVVESIPGSTIPNPTCIPSPEDISESIDEITIARPKLRFVDKPAFSVQITFLTEPDRKILSTAGHIGLRQTLSSPCIITIIVGTTDHVCQFPFPVDGKSAKLRIARTSGWIEVVAPLAVAIFESFGYEKTPWPVIRKDDAVTNWNMSNINFSNLPRIEPESSISWYGAHLQHMYSDRERQQRMIGNTDPVMKFKECLIDVFGNITLFPSTNIPVRFAIKQGDILVLFLITGLFLDPASHNVVAEAYAVETKPNTKVASLIKKVDFMTVSTSLEEARFWRMALPAMIERCRDWEHKENCEHKNSTDAFISICSCGIGKLGSDFMKIGEWADLGPFVARCALSPVFPAPFVEQTRQHTSSSFGNMLNMLEEMPTPSGLQGRRPSNACHGCGRLDGTKKCGGCGRVYYCGKDCQRSDWKRHKPSCQKSR